MTTDLYTKAVLTVIALCLVWMCVNGATPVARAQTELPRPMPVVLVNEKGFPIYTQQGLRVNHGTQPLPVTVTNAPLSVSVRSIQQGSPWDPVRVQVMRETPTQKPLP